MVSCAPTRRAAAATSLLIITEDGESWMAESLQTRFAARGRCELRTTATVTRQDLHERGTRGAVFVRSRSPRLLQTLQTYEQDGGVVINSPAAILRARHRATVIALAAAAGVPAARDYEGPLAGLPFAHAVLKSRFDSGQPTARVHQRGLPPSAQPTAGPSPVLRGHRPLVYAQELIRADWEHKLYLVGAEPFAFVQRPTLLWPDKFTTRRRIDPDPALVSYTRRVAQAVGLEVVGVDFLVGEDGVPRVTDVNSNQGLHTFAEGYEALERHILCRLGETGVPAD